ncbi:hypothetical protein [Streptomyces cyaneofuscatus]|uniref:hypothetical protein n=1 Tax=Streptomyces cyaneofuscatus TaxID=66883 RepID=UPI00380B7378
MANGVWHTGYGIEVNLFLPDLGHPYRPDPLREITARVSERDPYPVTYYLVCAEDELQRRLTRRDKPVSRWDALAEITADKITVPASCDAAWTSCSWHCSAHHRPSGEFVDRMQRLVRPAVCSARSS